MPFEVKNEADIAAMIECRSTVDSPTSKFECMCPGRYRLSIPQFAVVIEIDRLRRERNELFELSVMTKLPNVKSQNGFVSIADMNVSGLRARQDRARFLTQRTNLEDIDWVGILEEFCQRVLAADRIGQPAVDLRTLRKPAADDVFRIDGFPVLRRNPTIIFGDGGAAKSYLALYLAGRLAEQGIRVALFDWELAGEDHRERLERLFGDAMPRIIYARCERPLNYDVDRLRHIYQDERIELAIYDSVAFACNGAPESAEVASEYFGSVRQIGVGSLHIAHISKAEGADKKPFGSAFWHNGARSTWFVKPSEQVGDSRVLTIGLFQRKANLGSLRRPIGFRIAFGETTTKFSRTDVAEEPELAAAMTVREKMAGARRRGAMDTEGLAKQIDETKDTVGRTARRHKNQFKTIDGGKIALRERGS